MSVPEALGWETLDAADGVRLRGVGSGRSMVVLPGMEGDGSSCLPVALPVWQRLQRQAPVRLVLVDYAEERHANLAALEATVTGLLSRQTEPPALVWGQSFGCLLAASVARAAPPDRLVLVSPFTDLPTSRDVAAASLRRIPRPLYRETAVPVSRWVFGPAHGHEGEAFLRTLRAADPGDLSRRAGWLRGGDQRAGFEDLLGERAGVWFGIRDRLIDLRDQLEVFTALSRGRSPALVPHTGHVALTKAGAAFLSDQVEAWLQS